MNLIKFYEMWDDYEHNISMSDDDLLNKYFLSPEELHVMNLTLQQRDSLLTNLFVHYFKGGEDENK